MEKQLLSTCYIRYHNEHLTIGNELIERTWSCSTGVPIAVSLLDKSTDTQWLGPALDESVPGCLPGKGTLPGEPLVDIYDDLGIAAPAMRVRLPFTRPQGVFMWTHLIYPGCAFIRSRYEYIPHAARTSTDTVVESEENETLDTLDGLTFSPQHLRWRTVTLYDVTDRRDNLVQTQHGFTYHTEKQSLQGNLLFFTDVLTDRSVIVVKESATPLAQLNYPGHDFYLHGKRLSVTGSGIGADDLAAGEAFQTYGVAVGVAQEGETGALLALQQYHRCVHEPAPARDFYVMSNTWGDRSRDLRVSEAFVLSELPVAAKLGISIYQIDDGWQRGATTASNPNGRWEGFHAAEAPFWEPHPERFPNGLAPIAAKAAALGLRLGLWFAPDSVDHFKHWEDDAAILVNLHRAHHVTHFKIDAVKLRSKIGEERFVRMLQRVIEETEGQVTFNLDVTAEIRLGYFGRSHYGNLFLENRYTDFRSYYPHRTLRNLWMLARYFPTNRLQMEFLNVRRNSDKYPDDPLAPIHCGIEYAFGTTVCANPLAWMELTGLTDEDQKKLAPELAKYKEHQEAILNSIILPIGQEPDGTGWTGFQCITDDKNGYLVIYREADPMPRHRFRLWQLASCRLELELVAGRGQEQRLEVDARGETRVTLPHPLSFTLYRYTRF
ncbi:MAG: alpha-galactosidase [Limnochordia bacterium]|jgi:alpha-galactosidase